MNNQEYEQKKRECWDALHKELLDGEVQWQPVSRKEIVNFAFDRAYALGKQEVKRHVSVKEACEILGVDESEATKLVKSEPIETCTDDCSSPDHFVVKDEMVDNIIKDGFREHNRLHIAAMMVPSVIATVPCSENEKGYAKMVATRARILADALISECEKGDNNA